MLNHRLSLLLSLWTILLSFQWFTSSAFLMLRRNQIRIQQQQHHHQHDDCKNNKYELKLDAISKQQLGQFESLDIISSSLDDDRSVQLIDLSANVTSYHDVWNVQKEYHQRQLDQLKIILNNQKKEDDDDVPMKNQDVLIFTQHKPVYTLGTGSDPSFVHHLNNNNNNEEEEVEVVRIERGGEVTCHCPGQLVAYPIFDLRRYKQDIHWYIRALEEAIIIALTNVGVEGAMREDDVTGVWVQNKKVAAIGVKARRWVTMHGLAVNVETHSKPYFDGIVPCGLVGREVGCINDFLDEPITLAEFVPYLKSAMQQVFQIKLKLQ